MTVVLIVAVGIVGFLCGFIAGKSRGTVESKTKWYDFGKSDGFSEGKSKGYKDGYDDGFKEGNKGGFTQDEKDSIRQVLAVLTYGAEKTNED